MNKGKRYEEPKLNMKKVFAVIIAIIVIIMCIFMVKGILEQDKEQGKVTSKDYFAVYKDNKWGIIDETGNTIIDPSYAEMIIVPNSKNDVFLYTYDVNNDTGEYKTKARNSKNETIFEEYEQVEAIQNKDKNNNLWYESNILKVKKNEKYGTINFSGKVLLPCEYDEIVALDGVKGALKISKDGKYGVADLEGKVILKTEYKEIQGLEEEKKAGFIIQGENEKFGIVDISGNQILETKYDGITKIHGGDLYVVKQEGKQILVKKDGTEVLNNGFDEITAILKNSENGIIYKKENQYGVMKTSGENVIDATYEELKEAKTGILIAKKGGKYGIIDLENNTKVEFKYTSILYNESADLYIAENADFNNEILDNTYTVRQTGILVDLDTEKGYMELSQNGEYKYYNFKFEEKKANSIFTSATLFLSKKDGKYGFVDKDGKVVVDYIYDDATKQNKYGYAGIKKGGKWGAIDKKGNIVQEPTYNLEEYYKVDFIGKWHLGKDLNMNYYNQL